MYGMNSEHARIEPIDIDGLFDELDEELRALLSGATCRHHRVRVRPDACYAVVAAPSGRRIAK
jgi:hypothetical protein